MTKAEEFIEIAEPDADGITREISTKELPPHLRFGNGASWARAGSQLDKTYNVIFKKEKGNAITHIKLEGHKRKKDRMTQSIRANIRTALKDKRCVMCGKSSQIEIDHKDGRKDNPRVMEGTKNQELDDFQPLCKGCNDQKRQACKDCKKTDKRFDATTLNYACPVTEGGLEYEGTCEGCHWHDPSRFKQSFYLKEQASV